MLHHRHPAAVGRGRHVCLALVDVGEGDLVELVAVGVHGRAGERAVEARLLNRAAVAGQFHVQRRVDRCGAVVGHVKARVDHVAAALEDVRLDQLGAALVGGQRDGDIVAGAQITRAGRGRKHRRVVREIAADDARARQIGALDAAVEEHHRVAIVVLLVQQLQLGDDRAGRVDGGAHHVGRDDDLFRSRCLRDCARGRSGLGACGCRCGALRHVACGRAARCGSRGRLRRREEHRLVAIRALPVVEQQDNRQREDHPENGAFDIHVGLRSGKVNRRPHSLRVGCGRVGRCGIGGAGHSVASGGRHRIIPALCEWMAAA